MEAKIWNLNKWISETDPAILCKVFDDMIHKAGFNVLGELEHHFQPQGYTKLYLLSESHFAIHTFPEAGKTYIELSSCNHSMQEKFTAMLECYMKEGVFYGKGGQEEKGL